MPQTEQGHLLALEHAVGGAEDAHKSGEPAPNGVRDPLGHVLHHAAKADDLIVRDGLRRPFRSRADPFHAGRFEMFQPEMFDFQDV